MKALESMHIGHLADKEAYQLSGDEKQRVAIARAIVSDPDYIFADEPTGSLDSENTESVLGSLKELNHAGKTVVIITHDSAIAGECHRILELEDGHLVG